MLDLLNRESMFYIRLRLVKKSAPLEERMPVDPIPDAANDVVLRPVRSGDESFLLERVSVVTMRKTERASALLLGLFR